MTDKKILYIDKSSNEVILNNLSNDFEKVFHFKNLDIFSNNNSITLELDYILIDLDSLLTDSTKEELLKKFDFFNHIPLYVLSLECKSCNNLNTCTSKFSLMNGIILNKPILYSELISIMKVRHNF